MSGFERLQLLQAAYTLLKLTLPVCRNTDQALNTIYRQIKQLEGNK